MQRKRILLIGVAFLVCLMLSYYESTSFFKTLTLFSQNPLLFFLMIFINNITVSSLILLGMTFYVSLVISNVFQREKHARIILEHPRVFALVFAVVLLVLSILRGANFFLGGIWVETLPSILLVSTPIGIIEGYGLYLTIRKTLSRTITIRGLVSIYGIFILAALIEVGFINLLAGT